MYVQVKYEFLSLKSWIWPFNVEAMKHITANHESAAILEKIK